MPKPQKLEKMKIFWSFSYNGSQQLKTSTPECQDFYTYLWNHSQFRSLVQRCRSRTPRQIQRLKGFYNLSLKSNIRAEGAAILDCDSFPRYERVARILVRRNLLGCCSFHFQFWFQGMLACPEGTRLLLVSCKVFGRQQTSKKAIVFNITQPVLPLLPQMATARKYCRWSSIVINRLQVVGYIKLKYLKSFDGHYKSTVTLEMLDCEI